MGRQRQLTFHDLVVSTGLEAVVRSANPWWEGEPIPDLPRTRRWPFDTVLRNLRKGLTPAVMLRGPRQVGKTTLLNHVIDSLLSEGLDPKLVLRIQFDELPDLKRVSMPIIELCEWYSTAILGMSFAKARRLGSKPLIFLDEVQNLPDWAPQLKTLVDLNPVRVMVTGSSALRIEQGRDSLAGRVTTVEMGPLLLREVAEIRGFGAIAPCLPLNGLGPLKRKDFWQELRAHGERNSESRRLAFDAFSARGGYPVSQARADEPWDRIAEHLNESIVKRAIEHDLRIGPKGKKRDEVLLREVFKLACRYAGQSPKPAHCVDEMKKAMNANIGPQRILAYLRFLDGTLLLRMIEPPEMRLKRNRGAAKLCLCDHALRAAWLQEVVPLTPEELNRAPDMGVLAGRIAESVAGYFLGSVLGQGVAHFPERGAEPEVDFVLTIGEQRVPIEVKYRRRIGHDDTTGLRSFMDKAHNHAPFGVLVTLLEEVGTDDPRIVSVPLSTLLLLQ